MGKVREAETGKLIESNEYNFRIKCPGCWCEYESISNKWKKIKCECGEIIINEKEGDGDE